MPHVKQSKPTKRYEEFRVLIDANVLISYLLVPDLGSSKRGKGTIPSIIDAAFNGDYKLLIPGALLIELTETIKVRKDLAKRISPEQAAQFVELLQVIAEPIEEISEPIPSVTRDPKDDYLLAYALVGRADYLVTGDDGLLTLKEVEGVKIVRPIEFKEILDV